ncbi:DUF4132 domain-containing protein [Nocardiopsis lucentensis]|uniref:DUF4132 domain-containing protein n=1 Tax=Nocardiopsis lucentensis TaxID=53441 RepID=UPI000345FF20|nr:DUF4132 domain-containing protein [Nocardiopsis lucentensis]
MGAVDDDTATRAGAWAAGMISDHGLPPRAEEFLARLHEPGLDTAVRDLDTVVRETAASLYGGYHDSPLPEDHGPRTVTDRLTSDLSRRLTVWCLLLSHHDRSRAARDMDLYQAAVLYERTAHHLLRRTAWEGDTLALLLDTVLLDLVEAPVPVAACEEADEEVSRACLDRLRELRARMHGDMVRESAQIAHMWEWHVRTLRLLLRLGDTRSMADLFAEGDLFGDLLRTRHPDLFTRQGLADLFVHCLVPPGRRPTRAWRRATERRLADVPRAPEAIRDLLDLVPTIPDSEGWGGPGHFQEHAHDILTGMVWCAEILPEESTPWAIPVLERLARFTGTGPGTSKQLRSERMASAAVRIIAERGDDRAVAALGRIRGKVRKKTLLKTIDTALSEIADREGVTNEELLERTVPDFGLGRDRTRTELLDGHPVTLSLADDGTAALGFVSAKGRPAASPPKPLRESHPDRIKELRAELKELRATVSTERAGAETFLAQGRIWKVGPWVRHHLEHPVTGTLARRLIWEVDTGDGRTWRAGLPEPDGDHWRLADHDSRTVAHTRDLPDTARVRLWHPVRHRPETVRRWRDHLTDREIAQPVKQAYREIYLLTPAEEATGDHSLRFAAHILKYAQARALLTTRGWSQDALSEWDGCDEGTAQRTYTDRETGTAWRATWDLRLIAPDEPVGVRTCGTGRVRFNRVGAPLPVALAEVPVPVLSEAMRDLDLAVGVTSIAADPEWDEAAHRPYWRRTAFGALTENAEVRRAALAGLLPKLRGADRWELGDRFLRVRGDLRTYRIHLGSANILMEPDDAYLCVVPSGKAPAGLFLPFEDAGGRLSVILSKAFLLTDDAAITDPGIAAQIRRGVDDRPGR